MSQPRGYAGDAELIDYIYFQQHQPELCDIGHALFLYNTNAPASSAVRERRNYLAHKIDEVAAQRSGARVLSMACGHLREARLSQALRQGDIAELVAMDQDEQSLAEVAKACAGLPVTALQGSVQQWLRNRFKLGGFDLVYAAGLYDYLNQHLGAAFTEKLFNTLRPGGQLVIPNFLPDVSSVGYMECCMKWWLIYRGEQDMLRLLERIP
jgi:trans-aconitate methyltransferase